MDESNPDFYEEDQCNHRQKKLADSIFWNHIEELTRLLSEHDDLDLLDEEHIKIFDYIFDNTHDIGYLKILKQLLNLIHCLFLLFLFFFILIFLIINKLEFDFC